MPYQIIKLNPKTYQVVEKDSKKIAYLINKRNKTCFSVINTKSGKVHSNCTSLQNAKAQLRLLYGLERSAELTERSSKQPKVALKTNGLETKVLEKSVKLTERSLGKGKVVEEDENYGDGLYISHREPKQPLRVVKKEGDGLFAGGQASIPGESSGEVGKADRAKLQVGKADSAERHEVPVKETWKTFFTRHATGMKFATADDSRVFMRKVGELWKNHKNAKKMSKAVEADAKKSMKMKLKKQVKSMKE